MTLFSQAILKGALLPAHLAAGIELFEPDDHMLVLRCKGEVIATYSSIGVRVEQIRNDANEWLEKRICEGNTLHDWEQKYIYLDNATDATPYCKCRRCGVEKDGWLENREDPHV